MKYRLVVTDLDGTLLDNEKRVSSANIEAIKRLREAGIMFTIATGRGERAAGPFIKLLGIDMPAVLFNGGEIYDPSRGPVYTSYLEKDVFHLVIDHFRNSEMGIVTFHHDRIFIADLKPSHDLYLKREKVEVERLKDPEEVDEVNKILLVGDVPLAKKMMAELEKKAGIRINHVQSDRFYLEVIPDGVSKAEGLRKLCDILGIDRQSVVAIGDNMNDLSMIEFAGLGVAVENAEEEIKRAAGLIVPANTENGVAYLIKKIIEGDIT
ncbi:Cof-type HAD-IIB family hydrolase [Thermosediminibacter oceani]|uniref:Cof-like hydrolase n=1 Tax=Thermosediminibacter oceani (strain ATCC BAA-1034 / DSM 16646 / JW/IW-1228P) TaxID=555079 RepID=D9S1Y1_THEOJ|nr:Cof-type HAD-IIB family hydrolase [Thermosediminibacter oceani]ADL07408.1 Cof-like hydrolase [Thermosediminibacter oceani DSM 16646]